MSQVSVLGVGEYLAPGTVGFLQHGSHPDARGGQFSPPKESNLNPQPFEFRFHGVEFWVSIPRFQA
jgi:hypothetical protein